jgi:hypothetical protein
MFMIVVIQCQGKKHCGGSLSTASGQPVTVVAQPQLAPADGHVYARPDDLSEEGRSWREVLLDYNRSGRNPQGLLAAYHLYQEPLYGRLAERVGLQDLYILSAGWGLIPATFLTPYYDITFSQVNPPHKYKRRLPADRYSDFAMIPAETSKRIIFFGSKSYVPLFCSLTRELRADRTVFYNTEYPPEAPGCTLKKYTRAKRDTNWQFDCASDFLDGTISV